MIKKKHATCGRGFLEDRKKVSVFKQIRILYIETNGRKMKKKKRCNKKLEVATVFYILCIFGGENFTLTVLYVAGKLPPYPSPKPD